MKLPLQIATVVFNFGLLTGLVTGMSLIWMPPGDNVRLHQGLRNIGSSSTLLILISGLYIASCCALACIGRRSKHNSSSPSDE